VHRWMAICELLVHEIVDRMLLVHLMRRLSPGLMGKFSENLQIDHQANVAMRIDPMPYVFCFGCILEMARSS
jgi:hypothetical protein